MKLAGIDTSVFKTHSTKGAVASSAFLNGETTQDILQAADWSRESVFQKFYYKPVKNWEFGKSVLSSYNN